MQLQKVACTGLQKWARGGGGQIQTDRLIEVWGRTFVGRPEANEGEKGGMYLGHCGRPVWANEGFYNGGRVALGSLKPSPM